jgi:hypothetical protein
MKTKSQIAFAAISFLSAALFFSAGLNHGVAQNRGPVSPVRTCWCCIGGSVRLMTVPDCQKQGGQCFSSEQEASRYCASSHAPRHRVPCWCCIPFQGIPFNPDPRYKPPGTVTYTTEAECGKKGGHCFSSKEEALRYCGTSHRPPPTTCWCCFGSGRATTRVIQTTMAECQARGGSCYQSRKEAERDCFMRGEFH